MLDLVALNFRLSVAPPVSAEWLAWHLGCAKFHRDHAADIAGARSVDLSSLGINGRNLTANNVAAGRSSSRKAAADHLRAARRIARALREPRP